MDPFKRKTITGPLELTNYFCNAHLQHNKHVKLVHMQTWL